MGFTCFYQIVIWNFQEQRIFVDSFLINCFGFYLRGFSYIT